MAATSIPPAPRRVSVLDLTVSAHLWGHSAQDFCWSVLGLSPFRRCSVGALSRVRTGPLQDVSTELAAAIHDGAWSGLAPAPSPLMAKESDNMRWRDHSGGSQSAADLLTVPTSRSTCGRRRIPTSRLRRRGAETARDLRRALCLAQPPPGGSTQQREWPRTPPSATGRLTTRRDLPRGPSDLSEAGAAARRAPAPAHRPRLSVAAGQAVARGRAAGRRAQVAARRARSDG